MAEPRLTCRPLPSLVKIADVVGARMAERYGPPPE